MNNLFSWICWFCNFCQIENCCGILLDLPRSVYLLSHDQSSLKPIVLYITAIYWNHIYSSQCLVYWLPEYMLLADMFVNKIFMVYTNNYHSICAAAWFRYYCHKATVGRRLEWSTYFNARLRTVLFASATRKISFKRRGCKDWFTAHAGQYSLFEFM